MSALLPQIAETVEEIRVAQVKLLELIDQLRDATMRELGITERMVKTVTNGLDAPGVVRLPRALQPNGGEE